MDNNGLQFMLKVKVMNFELFSVGVMIVTKLVVKTQFRDWYQMNFTE